MADHLPLLVFPDARTVVPPKGHTYGRTNPHFPSHGRQVQRLTSQFDTLQQEFSVYKATVSNAVAGLEPETVLVIEIAGTVEDFKQAVEATEGLEWLGEWDIEDIEPDMDFYEPPKIGPDFFKHKVAGITSRVQSRELQEILKEQKFLDADGKIVADEWSTLVLPDHLKHLREDVIRNIDNAKNRQLTGRLFLSLCNERGLRELLTLWGAWQNKRNLPHGKTKWRDVFAQTLAIRRWGIQETVDETGMRDRWRDLLEPIVPDEEISFQIELFYRKNPRKRQDNETIITTLLREAGGKTLGPFVDMPAVAFHAVKAALPAAQIRHLLDVLESAEADLDVRLFRFQGIMYFRPTGQSLATSGDDAGEPGVFAEDRPDLPPIVAILDGVPNLLHDALRDRLLFDDPDNLAELYRPGERRHGTAMASLVIHGELQSDPSAPLTRKVHYVPIMQPNPAAREFNEVEEHVPNDIFFEDRIARAVRRMFEGEGTTPPQAPGIKIINISIADPDRPFVHTPSPWARLLDWLAWKYRVLFCVSAGNFRDAVELTIPHSEFSALPNDRKVFYYLNSAERQLSQRRLLSPAESINALTIGALHADQSGDTYSLGHRTDLAPNAHLFSPVSRLGHGFRRAVKPEIFLPGGRCLYITPLATTGQSYEVPRPLGGKPGQKVAYDSTQQGETSKCVYLHGTSNAAALATRNGARIYEVLAHLQREYHEKIPENLVAVLIKALLVHGAQQAEPARQALECLRSTDNSQRFKEVVTRYLGYGAVNIERVLACTEQRGTVIGCNEIAENQIHEYCFPLPLGLSGTQVWRRMIITLAWFSPINPAHRHVREAKLTLQPAAKWHDLAFNLSRQQADHAQVLRGTVQHEILEGAAQIAPYQEGAHISLRVICKKEATEKLDDVIPYGLAVTLEVAEGVDIPVYQQLRAAIKPQVAVVATSENL